MNRQSIADKIRTAGSAVETAAAHLADRIDPPTFGVKIVWDGDYDASLDDIDTLTALNRGALSAVGMVAYQRDSHGVERETDRPASLWGIVVDSSEIPSDCLPSEYGCLFGDDLAKLGPFLRSIAADLRAEAGV